MRKQIDWFEIDQILEDLFLCIAGLFALVLILISSVFGAYAVGSTVSNLIFDGLIFFDFMLAAIFWIFCVFALFIFIKQKIIMMGRETEGRCINCGYELQGLPWNSKCPECGEAHH